MKQINLRQKNPAVRVHKGHASRRLIATIVSAIACSLIAIVIVGIIDQQPANQGDGQATVASDKATSAQATLTAKGSSLVAANPSPTATEPLLSELLPPLAGAGPTESDTATGTRYYTETGHYMSGDFLTFYENVPDRASLFGLPLTEEFKQQMPDGTTLNVQYFERARLDFHPDATPHVQLGILTPEILKGRTFDPVPQPPASGSLLYFPETGHTLSGGFLDFWQSHGGLAIFGYPLSEELGEDGMTVQYFERTRTEYHQDLVGTPYGVQLSPVGYLALPGAAPRPLYGHAGQVQSA